MSKLISILLCLSSVQAFIYEEPCILVIDTITQEKYIEIDGHCYDILWINHQTDCPECKAVLHHN